MCALDDVGVSVGDCLLETVERLILAKALALESGEVPHGVH